MIEESNQHSRLSQDGKQDQAEKIAPGET